MGQMRATISMAVEEFILTVWVVFFFFFRALAERAFSFGHHVTNPLQVRRVSLVDGQADDLGHFIWMV